MFGINDSTFVFKVNKNYFELSKFYRKLYSIKLLFKFLSICSAIKLNNRSADTRQWTSDPRQINLSKMNKLPNTHQSNEHDSIDVRINEVKTDCFQCKSMAVKMDFLEFDFYKFESALNTSSVFWA